MNSIGNVTVLENIQVKPATQLPFTFTGSSYEGRIRLELNDVKKCLKESHERQKLFETRMEAKFDVFLNCMSQIQNQRNNRSESRSKESYLVNEDDDFEDLDESFPIKVFGDAPELERRLRSDLTFKFRLVNQSFTFCKIKFCFVFK